MSFILSCEFWFCCGGAKDDPADRYHQPPPPPPSSQTTQMVAVVQQVPQPVAQQPSHHHMPPHLAGAPTLPPAMGYAIPPPHQATPWPHVPRTGSYDPPQPVMRQPSSPAPAATMVSYDDLLVSPQTVPPSKSHHDLFQPSSAETATTPSRVPPPSSTKAQVTAQYPGAQAPWPARQPSNKAAIIQQAVQPPTKVPSKRCVEETPSQMTPSRVPSMKMKKAYDEPPPAPVATSQRPPQATWPTRQPSKTTTYQTQPEPPRVSYDTPVPAVVLRAEVFPPAASMAPRAPQHPQSL